MSHLAELNLGRVFLVCAHRSSEQRGGPFVETLGRMHRIAQTTRIVLSGLAREHAVSLMAAVVGGIPDQAAAKLVYRLHTETDGNPFYLTEMLRHLMDTGVISMLPGGRCTASAAIDSAGLPDSIREVVRARAARLGDRASIALSMAAVIGQAF